MFSVFRYSETHVQLLGMMLHAAIRGLNSLADLDTLQGFVGKYFGPTVENRDQTLVDVLHFEEEILRQKVSWREKYETVISGWIEPKSAKIRPKAYNGGDEDAEEVVEKPEVTGVDLKPSGVAENVSVVDGTGTGTDSNDPKPVVEGSAPAGKATGAENEPVASVTSGGVPENSKPAPVTDTTTPTNTATTTPDTIVTTAIVPTGAGTEENKPVSTLAPATTAVSPEGAPVENKPIPTPAVTFPPGAKS